MPEPIWPDQKTFAFTIFDDTDHATRETVAPVYDLLRDLGLRTTKSVWTHRGSGTAPIGGATCEDDEYRDWTLRLQADGFEIASHGTKDETSTREEVRAGLDRFRRVYGSDPSSHANHAQCRESIYWGEARVSGAVRVAYGLATAFRNRGVFRGHIEGDPLFWGDLCRDRVRYVRNFTFTDVNTLAGCPLMPYSDPQRPWVRAWFAASEGRDVGAFNRCLTEEAQDRLERDRGACIMYTHFASGFVSDGRLDERFVTLMTRLASKNGWFVPASTMLDHLARQRGTTTITPAQRAALERRWLRARLRSGHT
jgi:hypothetical protein